MKNRAVRKKEETPELEREYSSALPDAALFILTSLSIIFFGLIVLYSTSYAVNGISFFSKQLMWMGIGFGASAGVILIGYKNISNISPALMIIVALLLLVAMKMPSVKGANRWIPLGPFRMQPSEFAKVILVLFLAWFLANRTRAIETSPLWKVFLPAGLCAGPVILLVLAGKDLGTTILLGSVFLIMLFVAGVRLLYILPFVVVLPPAGYYYIMKFDPERMSRLTSFSNPELLQKTDGYQLWNSMLALGSGEWFGIGFTESRLKLKYLPEAHTDFILSIVGEELGYVSILAVLCAYILLIVMGIRIGSKARTRQGMLVAFGMVSFLAIQAIINVGVICGAFPTKGMPAPMISYGGSNLLTCMLAVSCVFSVALDNSYPDYPKELANRILSLFRSSGKNKGKRAKEI